jgi:hypothetical protein
MKIRKEKKTTKNTKENLDWIFEENRKVVSDYPDFEPIAPSEDDIAEELELLGTYL